MKLIHLLNVEAKFMGTENLNSMLIRMFCWIYRSQLTVIINIIRANFTNILNFALKRINFFCVKNKWGAPLTKIFHCKKFCILLWYFFFIKRPMLFNKSSENLIIMLVLVLNCSPFSKDTVLFARLLKESNKEYRWTNLFLTMEMKWQIK